MEPDHLTTVGRDDGVLEPTHELFQEGHLPPAGAAPSGAHRHIAGAVADQRLVRVQEPRGHDLAGLPVRDFPPLLVEQLDDADVGADVHLAVLALGGEAARFEASVTVVHPAAVGPFERGAHLVGQLLAAGQHGARAPDLELLLDDHPGQEVVARGVPHQVVGAEVVERVDVVGGPGRGHVKRGHVELPLGPIVAPVRRRGVRLGDDDPAPEHRPAHPVMDAGPQSHPGLVGRRHRLMRAIGEAHGQRRPGRAARVVGVQLAARHDLADETLRGAPDGILLEQRKVLQLLELEPRESLGRQHVAKVRDVARGVGQKLPQLGRLVVTPLGGGEALARRELGRPLAEDPTQTAVTPDRAVQADPQVLEPDWGAGVELL